MLSLFESLKVGSTKLGVLLGVRRWIAAWVGIGDATPQDAEEYRGMAMV